MMDGVKSRGKAIAISTVFIGVAVLVTAWVAAWGRIREEWWIYKLKKGAEEEQVRAAERLKNLGSVRAIPDLLKILDQNASGNQISVLPGNEEGELCRLEGNLDWNQPQNKQRLFFDCLTSLTQIVLKTKQSCQPVLIEALRDNSPVVRTLASNLLVLSGGSLEGLAALRQALKDNDPTVQQAAAEALKKIQGAQEKAQR